MGKQGSIMRFLLDFLRQKAPKSGKDMPAYYFKALRTTSVLLIIHFVVCFAVYGLAYGWWEIAPLVGAGILAALLPNIKRCGPRGAGLIVSFVVEAWCCWSIHTFGWSVGAQLFLIAPLMLSFFNVSEKAPLKFVFWATLVALRMGLNIYSIRHTAVHILTINERLVFQILNTASLYFILACLCILFSTSIQATERQLRIDNQELHKEAGTDPLTQLPNRRAMTDAIDSYLNKNAGEPFSVAIADIDFFKSVNDTYGHNCGDYTLRTLSDKFREVAGDRYRVCRWGGEEFCFFMPGMNLDQAGAEMHDMCTAVKLMPLSFEGHDFSITITIGVSENDFRSPLQAILEEADRKLYMGKNNGRDQVVF